MKFLDMCIRKPGSDNKIFTNKGLSPSDHSIMHPCGGQGRLDKIYIISILFIFVLFSLRVIGLDKDLPNFGLTFYQAKDEGSYSAISVLLYEYGSVNAAGDMDIVVAHTFRANIIGNLLQFVSMKILGDNYYGFRIPYVLITLGTMLLLYLTLKKIIEIYKLPASSKWLLVPIMLSIVSDFSFLMSSRCAENSSVRSFVTILCVYSWIKYSNDLKKRYFALGFLSITSIFFVYYSNVHLLVVSCMIGGIKIIQMIKKKENNFIKYLKNWGLGFGVGHILVEIYYFSVWKSGCWANFFSSLNSFSDRVVTVSQNDEAILITCLKRFLTFWTSNMFFFNFLIAILVIAAICINILGFIKTYDENILLVLGILLVMMLQATFTYDWMERKAISIYPVVYVSIFLAIAIFKWLNYGISRKMRCGICVLSFLPIIPLLYSMIRFRINRNYFVDFEQIDINIWVILTLVQIFFIYIFFTTVIFEKKKIYTGALLISFCLVLSVNIYFSAKYVYGYKEYSEKEAMIGIGEIVGNDYVAGPYAYAYTLYNDIKPVWNAENYCVEYVEEGKIKYFCDYPSGPYYVNLMNPDKDYSLLKSFDRKLIAQGEEFPIGLFIKNASVQKNTY